MVDKLYSDTAHLLRRAGFGAAPELISASTSLGLERLTDNLLNPERTADGIDDTEMVRKLTNLVPPDKNGSTPIVVVKMWWTYRMLTSPNLLQEKMTLFWHGHFTSKLGNDGDAMLAQNQTFRQMGLGNFRTLTMAISRDPAMLRYLNGNQNYKAHPNENYARELMELFTCGIGNYTEDDVKAAARAFSGWNLRGDAFAFNPRQHDNGQKTFMGKTGNWNGDDIVDMLVASPATAKRLCTQLFTYFGYDDPEPEVVSALVKTYFASGYDIRQVVGTILRSTAFYSDRARNAVIKSPVQYVIGSVNVLGLQDAFKVAMSQITPQNDMPDPTTTAKNPGRAFAQNQATAGLVVLVNAMRSMGQDILAPPNVKGWDGSEHWINSTTLLARTNFSNRLVKLRMVRRQAATFAELQAATTTPQLASDVVDQLAIRLGPLNLSPATRTSLINYLGATQNETKRNHSRPNEDGAHTQYVNQTELNLLGLMMSSSEFQVC